MIYVGKAKDLNKRVAQYFVDPDRLTAKTRILVSKIADVQYSVVDTEADALLLENNLIKQYKPRYNILLKDSKTYPWICVTSDEFPKVFLTRRLVRNGSRYFGPYSSVMHAKALLEFFRANYPLRSCKYRITSDAVLRHKFRPCLDLHLGRCRGCCIGAISQQEYSAYIEEIVRLLSGGVNEILRKYKAAMAEAADRLDFETAQLYKDRMDSLRQHYAKSIITSAGDRDVDVFSLVFDGPEAFGNFLRIRGGAIIQSLNLGFRMNIEEDRASVLSEFIAEINSKFGALGREVIVPFLPDVSMDGVEFRIPVRGDKLALLELSAKNAREYRFNSLRQREHTNPDEYRAAVLEELRKAIGMKELPVHMECFDNSNIQGTYPVASCVVFRNGEPSKIRPSAACGHRRGQGPAGVRLAGSVRTRHTGQADRNRPCQAARRSHKGRGPVSHVHRPQLPGSETPPAHKGRGSPLRHHLPPFAAQQGGRAFGAARDKGRGRTDRAAAADAFRQRGQDSLGFRRRAGKAGGSGPRGQNTP